MRIRCDHLVQLVDGRVVSAVTGFPVSLTTALTGVTPSRLRNWRTTGLLVPEFGDQRPLHYSFRDLVALRTVARLRSETSLQRIRRAFSNLVEFDLTDHPSEYQFAVNGKSIAVWTDSGFMDLVRNPGQHELYSLADVFKPFQNRRGDDVVDFIHPRPRLEVDARRLGGWPTIEGTRVSFDTVADAMVGDLPLSAEEIRIYYPGVSPVAALDALDFSRQVSGEKRVA